MRLCVRPAQTCLWAPILLLVLAPGPVSAQSDELLANAGFEEWADGRPTSWDGPVGTVSVEEADWHTGRRALRLEAVKEGDNFRAELNHLGHIAVRADTLYLTSVWGRGAGRLRIQIQQYDDTKWIGGCSSIHTDLTGEWTKYQLYYGVVGAQVSRVRFSIYLDDKDAVALLDDASLRSLGPTEPLGPNLVVNGDMESDADRDGIPDAWRLGRGVDESEAPLAVGPDGGTALNVRCSLPVEDEGGQPSLEG